MPGNKRILSLILKEIGKELNIQVIEHGDGWILELINKDKSLFIHGYTFPNNKSSVAKLCDDKAALSNILCRKNIPAIPHAYFMNPKSPYHTDKAWEQKTVNLLRQYKCAVIKPNTGTGGDCVFKVDAPNKLKAAIKTIFARFDAVAISPFYQIDAEYRLIVLNNQIELSYLKQRKQREWRHNLQLGATPMTISDETVIKHLTKLALKATSTIGIDFASVDIAKIGNTYKIMEINSGVMLEKFAAHSKANYQTAKNIYRKSIMNAKHPII